MSSTEESENSSSSSSSSSESEREVKMHNNLVTKFPKLRIDGHAPEHIELISKGNNCGVYILYENGAKYVLKHTADTNCDNVYYEALVGIGRINYLADYFPCFVRTKSVMTLDVETEDLTTIAEDYETMMDLEMFNLGVSMSQHGTVVVKQEYATGMTFNKFMRLECVSPASMDDIICILYQIYSVLGELHTSFTHYDLHCGNVIIEKLPTVTKFLYIDANGNEVAFCSQYRAYMIDYGRAYCDVLSNQITNMARRLYSTKQLKHLMGFMEGMTADNFWISFDEPNVSHDLKLASIVYKNNNFRWACMNCDYREGSYKNEFIKLLSRVVYEDFTGSRPRTVHKNNKIVNVMEFAAGLKDIVTSDDFQERNNRQTSRDMICVDLNMEQPLRYFHA